jgi:hypothetical protein
MTENDPIVKLVSNGNSYRVKKSVLIERSDYFNAWLQRFDVPDLDEELFIQNIPEYDEEVLKLLENPEYEPDPYAKDAVIFYGVKGEIKYRQCLPYKFYNSSYGNSECVFKSTDSDSLKLEKYHKVSKVCSVNLSKSGRTTINFTPGMSAKGFCLFGNKKDIEKVVNDMSFDFYYNERGTDRWHKDHFSITNKWIKQKMRLFNIKVDGNYFDLSFILREITNVELNFEISFYLSTSCMEDIKLLYSSVGPFVDKRYVDFDRVLESETYLKEKSQSGRTFTVNLKDSSPKMICVLIHDVSGETLMDLENAQLGGGCTQGLTYFDDMLQYDKMQHGIPNIDDPSYTITFGDINKKYKWTRSISDWAAPSSMTLTITPSDLKRTVDVFIWCDLPLNK